jgi:hypothetical protein
LGKVVHVRQRPYLFDIDPNTALASKGKKNEVSRMGNIETDDSESESGSS